MKLVVNPLFNEFITGKFFRNLETFLIVVLINISQLNCYHHFSESQLPMLTGWLIVEVLRNFSNLITLI